MCCCSMDCEFRKFCKQFWPKHSKAAAFLLIISTYTTILSILEQLSTREALKDADNQTIFTISDEISGVTVSTISQSILWNCREHSMTRNYYKTFYIILVTGVFVYIVIGMNKRVNEGCCNDGDMALVHTFQYLSDWCLRASLLFLITSSDIDPWLCFSGPSRITYLEDTQEVELRFPNSPLTYQRIGPIFTAIFGIVGWISGMFVLEEEDEEDD